MFPLLILFNKHSQKLGGMFISQLHLTGKVYLLEPKALSQFTVKVCVIFYVFCELIKPQYMYSNYPILQLPHTHPLKKVITQSSTFQIFTQNEVEHVHEILTVVL